MSKLTDLRHYAPPGLRTEWPLLPVWLTTALFLAFAADWLVAGSSSSWLLLMFGWLFVVILVAAFAVVRHAEALADALGEPLGTMILTLSVISIEVAMVSAVMLHGGENPTMARDTMFAVVMTVLNGLVGAALLIGGCRHREQEHNLQGANSFLAIILPLSIIGLVLPDYTHSTDDPSFTRGQALFVGISTFLLYGIFLAMETVTHRHYFSLPQRDDPRNESGERLVRRAGPVLHAGLLLAYLLPVVLLARKIALPVDYGIERYSLPTALGGMVVAVLILAPEALGAIRAAAQNQLQRSVNILLGSVAATIGLTVPAILIISVMTGKQVLLGLETEDALLLATTLALSMLTFSSQRTNVLLGAVHFVLFGCYLMLIFDLGSS